MSDLAIAGEYLSPELAEIAKDLAALDDADIEQSSRITYKHYTKGYDTFCASHSLDPHKPESVALYIAARVKANDSQSTLGTRLAAISRRARDLGILDPTADPYVKRVAQNARKKLPAKKHRVAPATYEALPQLVNAAQGRTRLRDVALVLLGFAIGRRGSELAGIDVEHIERVTEGIIVEIPKSKTNKVGEPEYVGVPRFEGDPYCPIAALDTWLEFAKITTGPVFLTLPPIRGHGGQRMRRQDIARRLDTLATAANLPGFWGSHSLRRGVVTSAEARGVARSRTRLLTGWRNDQMFAVYADHRDLIGQSPLHEIYGRRGSQRQSLFPDPDTSV